jgi:FkbM family methyltransferase
LAVRQLVRMIPDSLPSKTRIARVVVKHFNNYRCVHLPDRYGNVLTLPSLQDPIAFHLFAFGVYEPDTIAVILARLSASGVYVDVGANVGALALAIAAQRPAVRIVCIEADPEIAEVLRRNVADNKRSNIRTVECVAGPVRSQVAFYRAPIHKFGMGSIGPQFGGLPLRLRQRPLDDLLDELVIDDVDIVKLDVEGSELGVLRGLAFRLGGPRPPAIVFEFADWAEARIAGQLPGDAQAYLLSIGYRLFRVVAGGSPGAVLEAPLTSGSAMILAIPPSYSYTRCDTNKRSSA